MSVIRSKKIYSYHKYKLSHEAVGAMIECEKSIKIIKKPMSKTTCTKCNGTPESLVVIGKDMFCYECVPEKYRSWEVEFDKLWKEIRSLDKVWVGKRLKAFIQKQIAQAYLEGYDERDKRCGHDDVKQRLNHIEHIKAKIERNDVPILNVGLLYALTVLKNDQTKHTKENQ